VSLRQEQRETSLSIANGGPDPYPTVSNSGIAKAVDTLDAHVDRSDARNGADDHRRKEDSDPIDQNKLLSGKPQFSSSEKDISVVKPTSPNLAKDYFSTTGKLRVLAKRPAIDSTSSVRRAVAEGRDMSQVALSGASCVRSHYVGEKRKFCPLSAQISHSRVR
jgi:hypothetical protein